MSPPISSSGGYNLTHQGIYPIWTSLGTLDAASASGGPISAALNADEDGPDGEGGGGGGGGGGLISELEERLKSMSIRAGSTGRGSRSASASVSRRGSGTHTPRERKVSERTPHPRAHPHAHAHAHANTSHHSGHSASTYPQGPPSYLPAISHLLASRQSFPDKSIHPSELRPSISSSSEKVELRKLILTICGESKEGGKGDVEEMLRRGERSKAAFRAFFRGDESGTVGILMSSEGTSPIGAPPPTRFLGKGLEHANGETDPNDTLLGSTIAGFMSQSASARGSEYFNTHWPNLIRRVDDPYVRAILSRIAGEDWESVLEEEYIPLLERMVVGVQYLDDWEVRLFFFASCASLYSLHSPLGISLAAKAVLERCSSPHSSKAECPDSHVHPPYTCSLSPASLLPHSPSCPATSLEQAIYKPSPFSLRFSHQGNSIKRKRRWWRGGGKDIGICLIHGGCGGRGVSLMSSGGIYKDHWAGKMQVRRGMARHGHAQCVTIPCQSTLNTDCIRNMLCEVRPVLACLRSVQQFVFIVKRHYRDA